MLNYLRCERYRVVTSGILGVLAIIFIFGSVGINVFLALSNAFDDQCTFTTSDAVSVAMKYPLFFCFAAVVVGSFLYEEDLREGHLKNVLALGISREKIICVHFLVSAVVAFLLLVVSLVVYCASAYLLLPKGDVLSFFDLVLVSVYVLPLALSSLMLCIVTLTLANSSGAAFFVGFCVFNLIPRLTLFVGNKVELIHQLAMWMPKNFLEQGCVAWQSSQLFLTCLLSGGIGMLLFTLLGLVGIRNKEF